MKILAVARPAPGSPDYLENLADYVTANTGFDCRGVPCSMPGNWGDNLQRAHFLSAYHDIADKIDRCLREDPEFARYRIGLIMLDAPAGDNARPSDDFTATNFTRWSNIAALLVLTFPDILWLFGWDDQSENSLQACGLGLHVFTNSSMKEKLRRAHNLREFGFEPLYDPTGLRALIKENSFSALPHLFRRDGDSLLMMRRQALALVMDDEVEVAQAVAYAHYKAGHRVLQVTTSALFSECRSSFRSDFMPKPPIKCAESYTIAFPDGVGAGSISNPESRTSDMSGLFEKMLPSGRIVYTIDERQTTRATRRLYHLVAAPFNGVGGIIDQLGLRTGMEHSCWPPNHPEGGRHQGRHAIPGFLASAARRLISRVQTSREYDPRFRAMFALEAQELLLNRLPSLSLQAQQMRLSAEAYMEMATPTLFGRAEIFGSQALLHKFQEIRAECESILGVVFFSSARRRQRMLQLLQSQLIGVLIDAYGSSYHFHEEIISVQKRRELDLRANWVGSYIAWVLSSPAKFAAGSTSWMVLFAAIYLVVSYPLQVPDADQAAAAFLHSAITFVSVGPPPPEVFSNDIGAAAKSPLYAATLLAECALGVFHWGIGIAHLSMLLSRR